MPSYQDIETRLKTVEAKLEFVMNLIRIGQPSPLAGMPPHVVSLLDMYHAANQAGLEIVPTMPPQAATQEPQNAADVAAAV